jgi:UDPglucose 6-dehydrogenase
LGLTFKPNTDDMRDAPSITIIDALQRAGASIRAHDPVGMDQAKAVLSGVTYATDAYDAAAGADALVLVTEWNEFRALQLDRIEESMKEPVLIDMRNIYKLPEMEQTGFRYVSIGRPETVPGRKAKLRSVS